MPYVDDKRDDLVLLELLQMLIRYQEADVVALG